MIAKRIALVAVIAAAVAVVAVKARSRANLAPVTGVAGRAAVVLVADMREATKRQGDEAYFARVAAEAPATVKWIASNGIEFIQPTYYLAKGPPRIQPSGGGPAIIKELTRAARQAGVAFRYRCPVREIATDNGRITGLAIEQDGACEILPAGRARLWRLSGQRRDDACAFRRSRYDHAVNFARNPFQFW